MLQLKIASKMEDSPEMDDLKLDLAHHIGTTAYHSSPLTVRYTDGVRALIQHTNCGGLISDLSITAAMKFKHLRFQIWTITVKNQGGLLTMKEDTNTPIRYSQKYDYLKFPEGTIDLYLINGILLLPSEY